MVRARIAGFAAIGTNGTTQFRAPVGSAPHGDMVVKVFKDFKARGFPAGGCGLREGFFGRAVFGMAGLLISGGVELLLLKIFFKFLCILLNKIVNLQAETYIQLITLPSEVKFADSTAMRDVYKAQRAS